MQEKIKSVSKRSFQVPSGKVLAGEALASTIMGAQVKIAEAYTYSTGYEYVKLDPKEVGQITYENYFKRWCASSVIAGFAEQLKIKAGGQWKEFPIDAMRWAHVGMAGWGSLCGTLTGAGIIVGLVTDEIDVAEAMANDLAFYYSETKMPNFQPKNFIKAEIHDKTIAGTPICRISVGRWMSVSGAGFLTDERTERCARMAADVAMETAHMLNAWKDGNFVARHHPLKNVANGLA